MAFFKFSTKQLVATAIGTSLFFLLARFLSYQIPVFGGIFFNIHLNFQYAVIGFFAVVFGPICGFIIGLTGHFFAFLSFGNGIIWSSVIASACVGFLSGFMFKPGKVDEGEFDGMYIVRFIIISLIVNLISWGIVKPVADALLYMLPADEVFAKGLITGAGNFVITAIVGTLLIICYSKTREKYIEPE